MLPPALADLALNVKKARRSRAVIVVIGAFLALISLLIYGFAYTNTVNPNTFRHVSSQLVEWMSISFFLAAVIIGAICSSFLAASDMGKTSGREAEAPGLNGGEAVPVEPGEREAEAPGLSGGEAVPVEPGGGEAK
jgi:uncharacterized integral membrane protein